MPDYTPPPDYRGTPLRYVLPSGQHLWLVHGQKQAAAEFTVPRTDIRNPGCRFDGTYGDPYEVCYGALDLATAVADVVLRGISTTDDSEHIVRRTSVARLRASRLATVTDLALVDLCSGPALAAVAQDGWLVTADCADFPMTRRWGSWIRSKAPWANGFIWAARGREAHRSLVLFADRCADGVFEQQPTTSMDLDDDHGAVWLNAQLATFNARIEPPRRR